MKSNTLKLDGLPVHYLEAGPTDEGPVVLLHGARFNAETWSDLGTIDQLSESRVRVLAVDLPGFGLSPKNPHLNLETWLGRFLNECGLEHPIVVSPSMSGRLTLPLLVTAPERVAGWAALAPVGIVEYRDRLAAITCPVLAIWGGNDRIIPPAQADLLVAGVPNGRKVILDGARHPCYIDATDRFHDELGRFIDHCREN